MKAFANLSFLALACVLAHAQNQDCPSLSQQALALSGMNQQVDAIGQMALSDEYFEQIAAGGKSDPEVAAVVRPVIRKDLDAASLKKDLLRRVVARCKPEPMKQAVAEMQTALVARMLQLEAAQYTPEGQEKIRKYMRMIQIAPPPDSQLDSADAFDRKAGVTDFTVNSLLAVTRGMLKGAGAPDSLASQLQENRKQIKAQIQSTVLASILLTYSGVNKADLAKYADELSSGPLKWYYDAVRQSFVEMLEERAEAMGQDIKAAAMAKRAEARSY